MTKRCFPAWFSAETAAIRTAFSERDRKGDEADALGDLREPAVKKTPSSARETTAKVCPRTAQ
ncbi:hypothetical protein [Kitasatospora sp. P5_F3]